MHQQLWIGRKDTVEWFVGRLNQDFVSVDMMMVLFRKHSQDVDPAKLSSVDNSQMVNLGLCVCERGPQPYFPILMCVCVSCLTWYLVPECAVVWWGEGELEAAAQV